MLETNTTIKIDCSECGHQFSILKDSLNWHEEFNCPKCTRKHIVKVDGSTISLYTFSEFITFDEVKNTSCCHCQRSFRPERESTLYCSHRCFVDASEGLYPTSHEFVELMTMIEDEGWVKVDESIGIVYLNLATNERITLSPDTYKEIFERFE